MLSYAISNVQCRQQLVTTCRGIRKHWEQAYCKDLYNRRQMIGADPLIHRSRHPNWHYPSEITALKHRIGAPELVEETLVRSLTTSTFFNRDNPFAARLGMSANVDEAAAENSELVERGKERVQRQLTAIIRSRWSQAPEELVEQIVARLVEEEQLRVIAEQLGLAHVVRTAEFPPSTSTLIDALYALIGILDNEHRVHTFICDFILPPVVDLPFEDLLPFRDPLPIATDYLKKQGYKEIESRILHSSGVDSATPLYVVGIYADKTHYTQAPGERLSVAVDLAAQAALLRVWNVEMRMQAFSFLQQPFNVNTYDKSNHRLAEVVEKNRDLSLLTAEELADDPLKPYDVASHYFDVVRAAVGQPLRRSQRHKFSRGSLAKRSFRFLVKPRPYSVS